MELIHSFDLLSKYFRWYMVKEKTMLQSCYQIKLYAKILFFIKGFSYDKQYCAHKIYQMSPPTFFSLTAEIGKFIPTIVLLLVLLAMVAGSSKLASSGGLQIPQLYHKSLFLQQPVQPHHTFKFMLS